MTNRFAINASVSATNGDKTTVRIPPMVVNVNVLNVLEEGSLFGIGVYANKTAKNKEQANEMATTWPRSIYAQI